MDLKWKISLIFLLLIFLISGCKTDPRKEYEKAVLEWNGKTMLFPDSMQSIFGEKVEIPNSEYTIVAYFDSVGCTICRMQLSKWTNFMREIESIGANDLVSLILITEKPDDSLKPFIRSSRFLYNVEGGN